MGIPSEDAVGRVYAVRRSSAEGRRDGRRRDRERVPRPGRPGAGRPSVQPEGLAVVERIDLRGSTVAVDGRVALLLPARRAGSPPPHSATAASAATVLAGDAAERWRAPVRDPAGLAQAAFVYPLAHGATFPAAIPLDPGPRAAARGRPPPARGGAAFPEALPPAAVAAGWRAQSDRGMRLVLPDDRLAEAVAANRRFTSLLHDGESILRARPPTTGSGSAIPPTAFPRPRPVRLPARRLAGVLASYPARQRGDGFFFSQDNEWDSNGAALVALARHWRLARDTPFVEGIVEPIAAARTGSTASGGQQEGGKGDDAPLTGLLPPGCPPSTSARWTTTTGTTSGRGGAAGGRRAAAPPARRGRRRGGVRLRHGADVEASLALTAARLGTVRHPGRPQRRIDAGAVASLAALRPARPAGGRRPAHRGDGGRPARAVPARRRKHFFQGIGHSRLGTYLTMQLAAVELRAGDHRSIDAWLDARRRHPRGRGPRRSSPHRRRLHGRRPPRTGTPPRCCRSCRPARPREIRPDDTPPTVALSSLVPAGWYGQGWEVHGADGARPVSYAVRWHGDRVALWEVDPHPGVPWCGSPPRGSSRRGRRPTRAARRCSVPWRRRRRRSTADDPCRRRRRWRRPTRRRPRTTAGRSDDGRSRS